MKQGDFSHLREDKLESQMAMSNNKEIFKTLIPQLITNLAQQDKHLEAHEKKSRKRARLDQSYNDLTNSINCRDNRSECARYESQSQGPISKPSITAKNMFFDE